MTSPSELIEKWRGKPKPAAAAVTVAAHAENSDDSIYDLEALEAEWSTVNAAHEKEEIWSGRDPKVIERELHNARNAIRVAAKLNTDADGAVSRKEFEQFKVAVAALFIGIKHALSDPTERPDRVLDLVTRYAEAIGFFPTQAQAFADVKDKIAVVNEQFSNWDQRTKSQREDDARKARMMAPRWMG